MGFSDKLNSLFKLTGAKGKDLAQALYVTPPQITKMRKGDRGIPKQYEHSRAIALFFAEHCVEKNLREQLAKIMQIEQIPSTESVEDIADIILSWLSHDSDSNRIVADKANSFLYHFGVLYNIHEETDSTQPTQPPISENSVFLTYQGNQGRRLAVLDFITHLAEQKKAYQIDVLTDENITWATENAEFSAALQKKLFNLSALGCTFRRIVGPLYDVNQAFDSLNRWLPLYMTGQANSWYYKRLRDNLNHVTIFAVRNVAVLFSFSCGAEIKKSGLTFFTSEPKTVAALSSEFEKYLAQCEPIMKTYSSKNSLEDIMECALRYESFATPAIQYSDTLSFITLPWDVITSLKYENDAEKDFFLRSFVKQYKVFKQNLGTISFTDIIRLATPEDVIEGRVRIQITAAFEKRTQYYTVDSYIKHLKSILFLVNQYKNYHLIVTDEASTEPTILISKQNQCVLFARSTPPIVLFEVTETNLVNAFTEKLLLYKDKMVSLRTQSEIAVVRISALIEILQKSLT